jgi:tetratricopeptide (TPR) repeat protein
MLGTGHMDKAEKILLEVTQRHPDAAEAWLLLASVQGRQARYAEVVESCHCVLNSAPRNAAAHSLLGSACIALGRTQEAIEHLGQAAHLAPGDPGVLNNLGNALYAIDRFDEAANHYESALSLSPVHAQAHFGLGNCRLAQRRWSDALSCYQRAYNAMPDSYDINMSMGKANVNMGRLAEAQACLERATGLVANPAEALFELARVLEFNGLLTEALTRVQQSLRHHPGNVNARAKRAQIRYKTGDFEAAHQEVRALVDQEQITPDVILSWGEMCRHFGDCAEVLTRGNALIGDDRVGTGDAISLHFLLGRLQDREKNYDAAFEHYTQANTLMASDFDHVGHSNMLKSLMAAYTRDTFPALARSGCQDERPVFILGMPRSGTSLIEQILASHAQVFGAGELNYAKDLACELFRSHESELNTYLPKVTVQQLDALATRYLALAGKEAGTATRITDKMPANFLWLGLIAQMFPRAHVIHCVRDPRDTCLSIYFQLFSQAHPYASNLDDLAFYYRGYERMMAHWCKVLDLPMLEVRYDQLVMDQEGQTRAMLDFLGLPWDDACLALLQSKRATATASWDQVRQPMYTQSLQRWRNYQTHIGPLIDEFGDQDTPSAR